MIPDNLNHIVMKSEEFVDKIGEHDDMIISYVKSQILKKILIKFSSFFKIHFLIKYPY